MLEIFLTSHFRLVRVMFTQNSKLSTAPFRLFAATPHYVLYL